MNNIQNFTDFILEMKSERSIVQDLARHLAFDKDIIKYLNTSRAKRKLGWREILDLKLRGKNKDYINYITKNMVADYNPQITGYIHIGDGDEGDFDNKSARKRRLDGLDIEDQIKDIDDRISDIEDLLGIDPDNEETLDNVEAALDNAGYVKPEPPEKDEDIEKIEEPEEE